MDHLELVNLGKELAAATGNWLAEKAQAGFNESLLSEGLIIIPLVEYFTNHERWNEWSLKGEWYETGTSLARPGAVNYDLVAEYQTEKIILEFKYLKKINDQRLIRDFVKLALPKNADYSRFLVAAHASSCHSQGKSKSALLQSLTSAGRKVRFHLVKLDHLPELTSDLSIKYSLTGAEGRDIARIMTYDSSALNSAMDFEVELVASCSRARKSISVLSVSRNY